MEDKFGGNSTTYNEGKPVNEKLRILYNHTLTGKQYRVTVTYRFNEKFPLAIENRLLREPEFSSWSSKEKFLTPMYTAQTDALSKLYCTVTGFEFRTMEDGTVTWTTLEDNDEILR